MNHAIEKRSPKGIKDYFALVLTTFGVGFLPLAPGTWGSLVGVAIYIGVQAVLSVTAYTRLASESAPRYSAVSPAVAIAFLIFTLAGIWAAGRSTELLGDKDPSKAVIDEIIGQLVTFLFIPFTTSWKLILVGFLLFRLFDIWKPYPIDHLQDLPGGLGICADDILAGVYAGICLSIFYALTLYL